jgi:hypothetical protein
VVKLKQLNIKINMKKINKVYPINRQDVLLYGINNINNENIKIIGYRIKKENRFITPPKGWLVNFTHYEQI